MTESDKVTREEIEQYEEEHGETHPVFEVEHRPERKSVRAEPEPIAAERVDSGPCSYECDNDADYRVEVDTGQTFLCCQDCSNQNRIYAKENELLESEVTAE